MGHNSDFYRHQQVYLTAKEMREKQDREDKENARAIGVFLFWALFWIALVAGVIFGLGVCLGMLIS